MTHKQKIDRNKVNLIIFLSAFIVVTAYLISLNRESRNQQTKANSGVSPILHHQGEPHDVIILSLIERSSTGSRFKLRVTTPPNLDLLPLGLTLSKYNAEKIELLLKNTTLPYECVDTHDYNKDRIGYETQWFSGSPEEYLNSDIEVNLRNSDNQISTAKRTLSHSCTIFSADIGQTTTDNEQLQIPVE